MSILQYLEAAAYIVTVGGFPLAVALYLREKEQERREREDRTFDELDERYIQFMQLCLEHPEVDVSDSPRDGLSGLPGRQSQGEHALFAILISLFERAYVMFEGQHVDYRERMWKGWELMIRSYASRPGFRRAWMEIGSQFDLQFQGFMTELVGIEDGESAEAATSAG